MNNEIKYFKGNSSIMGAGNSIMFEENQILEIFKCSDDFIYFCINYIKIVDQTKGTIIPFDLYPYQRKMARLYDSNNRVIVLAPRQCGKSIFTIAYLLWTTIFNDYKTTVLVANKANTAKRTLQKIKEMYIHLPSWLKQGIVEWNKTQIVFENGSKIYAEATSSTGNRGDTVSILYIDECALIERNMIEAFFTSIYPTIASVKDAKIIISSTPAGYNFFHRLWTMAVNKQSEYVPFRVKWNEVPGRDEKYKIKTIAELGGASKGLRKWRQEFECFFVGSGGTLIDGEKLEDLTPGTILESRFEDKFTIYEYPEEEANYVVISDVAEGVGGDYSTSQVMKMLKSGKWKQVATFRDNLIKTNEFDGLIDQIAKYYNNALVIVESNSYGREILNRLVYEQEYENVFFEQDNKDFGLRMSRQTKDIGNSYLKSNIEDGVFELQDYETISELSKYVRKANTYKADDGHHDDLVTPLVLFSYFISNKENIINWIGDFETTKSRMNQMIESDLLPVGFICNGNAEDDLDLTSVAVNNRDEDDFNDE